MPPPPTRWTIEYLSSNSVPGSSCWVGICLDFLESGIRSSSRPLRASRTTGTGGAGIGSCLAPHAPQNGSPGRRWRPHSGQNITGFGCLLSSFQFLVRANLKPRNATETQNQKRKQKPGTALFQNLKLQKRFSDYDLITVLKRVALAGK